MPSSTIHPSRGRPPLPPAERANAHLHIRLPTWRKAGYLRAARKQKSSLAEWCCLQLDKAAGISTTDEQG